MMNVSWDNSTRAVASALSTASIHGSLDWARLWPELRWAWPLHVYGLACLFLVLACAAFLTVLGLRAQLLNRPHLSSLNVFLGLLGASRALALFIDPYGSKETIPALLSLVLWDVGFPSVLSAFSLLQLAFSQLKVSHLPSETWITLMVTFHFCLTLTSDILWTLHASLRMLRLVSQLCFSAWGMFLCFVFLRGSVGLLTSLNQLPLVVLPAPGDLAPKIRITDENDQTFSYVSESQANAELPLGALPYLASECFNGTVRHGVPRPGRRDRVSSHSRSQSLPLMSVEQQQGTEFSSEGGQPRHSQGDTTSSLKDDQRKALQESYRLQCGGVETKSRRQLVRTLLRRTATCAGLGAATCALQTYCVLGPHGLASTRAGGPARPLPWFLYQTAHRLVELILATILLNISRETLNCHANGPKHHRDSLFT